MREHAYAVYIMTDSRRGVLYVGVTSQMQTRAHQHRNGELSGFTRKHGCKWLVWFETHDDIAAAIHREKLIKRWRRAWKIALVEARNPEWADLAPALRGAERFFVGDDGGVSGGVGAECGRAIREGRQLAHIALLRLGAGGWLALPPSPFFTKRLSSRT